MSRLFSSLAVRISTAASFFPVVFKRLMHHRGVSFSSIVGIISVISMIICVPVFTNAVLTKVLIETLTEKAKMNDRALFSIHTYYRDDTNFSSLSVASMQYISQWIKDQISNSMDARVENVYSETLTQAVSWTPVKYKSQEKP